jgi:macrodomain Ter protein organizer (MatP/YcbG family)
MKYQYFEQSSESCSKWIYLIKSEIDDAALNHTNWYKLLDFQICTVVINYVETENYS